MTDRNEVLVGKIVSWPSLEHDDMPVRGAGYGKILAALDDGLILVRERRRPPSMLLLSLADPDLRFFDTRAEHDRWLSDLMNDPEPMVNMAGRAARTGRLLKVRD